MSSSTALHKLLLCLLGGFTCAAALAQTLGYRESSQGLMDLRMEGGKTELEFADVNADGNVDIVSIGDHGSPFINSDQHGIMVWFGDGTGRWALYMNGNFGYGGVALGDVNGDGLMDAGYAMHHNYSGSDFGDQLIEVALGDGTGRNWTPWDDGLATNGETYGMFGTDFADIDNDGDLDIGSISFGAGNGVRVYRNNGDGTWTQTFGFMGGNSTLGLVFGDFNGDGNADIFCGQGSFKASVYIGDGKGGFTAGDGNLPPTGNGGRVSVAVGDANADGRDDIAWIIPGGAIQVWMWVADGQWQSLSGTLPIADAVQLADMNLDGYGDIVSFRGATVSVYLGDGAGGWQLATSFNTPARWGINALRAGTDVDHNGYPDLALVIDESPNWWSSRNRARAYVETSVPTVPFVHPLRPRGGGVFKAGSVQFLDWTAGVPAGAGPGTMTVELSLDGPAGPWTAIDRDGPNSGRLQWRIPADTRSSRNCFVRYTLNTGVGDATVTTPAAFTIQGGGIPGDLNSDGCVNLSDLAILLAAFGSTAGGDLDNDGDTDLADLAILLANWGVGCV